MTKLSVSPFSCAQSVSCVRFGNVVLIGCPHAALLGFQSFWAEACYDSFAGVSLCLVLIGCPHAALLRNACSSACGTHTRTHTHIYIYK